MFALERMDARETEDVLKQDCMVPVQLLNAIQQYDLKTVGDILSLSKDVVNLTYGPLHCTIVQVACTLPEDKAIPLFNVLFAHGANVTSQDKLGRTPLHYAASSGHLRLVQLLLDNGASVNAKLALNSSAGGEPSTADFGLLKSLPLPECWGRTPLHQAVKGNHIAVARLLLSVGACVNAEDEHGNTPLLLAGSGMSASTISVYEQLVDLLLAHEADVNVYSNFTGTTPLHHSVALNSYVATRRLLGAGAALRQGACGQTPIHEAAGKGFAHILCLLLEHESGSLNRPDKDGRTALHKAAFAGSRECVLLLLKFGGDLSAETSTRISVVDIIFSHVPRPLHLLTDVFDSKVTCNDVSINDVDFRVTLDFNVLAPSGKERQMSVIGAVLKSGFRNLQLLQHPLLESFLCLKWNSLRIFFYVWVLTHLVFALSLSTYVIAFVHYQTETATIHVSRAVLLILSCCLFTHAVVQCLMIPRHYFTQYELWMNLACVFISFVVAIFGQRQCPDCGGGAGGGGGANLTDAATVAPTPAPPAATWMLHATSVAILLAWIELMFLIGRFPSFGYYALMFSTVLQNVIKVLLTFVCLIIGFSLSFAVQFHQFSQFGTPWKSVVKTAVMVMGEFEYDNIFQAVDERGAGAGDGGNTSRLPITSRIIFILFIVLASIVLMNLMVGLAVSDIQTLQAHGHVQRLAKQAAFLSHVEKLLMHRCLRSGCFPKWLYRRLYYNRSVNVTLHVKPAQAYVHKYAETRKGQRIPHPLVESIVKLALENKKQLLSDEELIDNRLVMNVLKQIQQELAELRAAVSVPQ